MFSKNYNSRTTFVNNIDATTRKKPVNIQKDNDIFNRRSLSSCNIPSSYYRHYFTETSPPNRQIPSFKSRPDNNLSVEIANKMYSNHFPSRNNDSSPSYTDASKTYNTVTNINNDSVGDLLSYDTSHERFYRKNASPPPNSAYPKPLTFINLKRHPQTGHSGLKHLSINELFESNRLMHDSNINADIAQYDLNEMTNYIKNNNIKDKIARRAEMTSKATLALVNEETVRENRSMSLQNKMEKAQSNYDRHLINKAKLKLKQKILELNIQRCNMEMTKKGSSDLQRREIRDFYMMNDKICEKKMKTYKNHMNSIVEGDFKAMKVLAVPNNCYPNRNSKQRNKLPFPVNGSASSNNRIKSSKG